MKPKSPDQEVDNSFNFYLHSLGVGVQIQRFFFPFYKASDTGLLEFAFVKEETVSDKELFGFYTHRLSNSGVWIAAASVIITDVFLFFSAMEAIAFAQLSYRLYSFDSSCAFAALGAVPDAETIIHLKKQFPLAKFHTVLGNELTSVIFDIKINQWLKGRETKVYYFESALEVETEGKQISLSHDLISLSLVCKSLGLTQVVKTHKPNKNLAKSYLQLLQLHSKYKI